MSDAPDSQADNELARAESLARIRERARAWRELLGEPDHPTPLGAIIWEGLRAKFGGALPPNVLDDHGRTDPYQTWRRLGHFDVLEYIRLQLTWKESDHADRPRGP